MPELPAQRLTCREVVELLTDYLEAILPPGERARVEEHLATCPGCTAYVEQLRTTIGVLGRLRDVDRELRALTAGWREDRGAPR